jgi:hypothetical protein
MGERVAKGVESGGSDWKEMRKEGEKETMNCV